MASVSGQGTTYNLPNYTGDLFQVSPSDTPFLSAIGGLAGALTADSTEFEWQTADIRATSAGNAQLEGADAPTANSQSRANVTNVTEIHQAQINVSYSKLAARGLKGGTNNDLANPVQNELDYQIQQELMAMAVDIEKSFLSGVYAKPANNATARKTRGILAAIATNVSANGGTPRALTKAIVDTHLSSMFTNGSPLRQESTVLVVGAAQKINLSNLYSTATLNTPTQTRNVGGVAVDTIVTDFGTFGVMLDRWMPTGQIAVVDLSVCAPVFLDVPGKGSLFVEPLAKTGASEKFQLYGEVGLKYGPEVYHGLIKDLS
jgi:hypothetical protein